MDVVLPPIWNKEIMPRLLEVNFDAPHTWPSASVSKFESADLDF
jgi:hypothetical protein